MQKQFSQHFQFQMNYQLSEDLADDDNERDPFTYRYAVANNFKPDYGFSDRMERHRFNAFGLWQAPWGIEFSPLISFHSPQPISVANRILPNGYIVKRNTLWKDNTFFAFDFRAAKNFKLTERFTPAGHRGRVQSDQSRQSETSGDHQPAVQFRWHGAERPGRSAAGAAWLRLMF